MMAGCNPAPGSEIGVVDGECVTLADYGEVVLCFDGDAGGPHVPGPAYYEVASERVFVFPYTLLHGPPGWEQCTCGEGDAAACSCVCEGGSTTQAPGTSSSG
jgi:hypothetical protein